MINNLKKKIPNLITTARLLLALIFPLLYLYDYKLLAFIIFVIAACSDFLDGFLARRWQVESKYGQKVDPIADKLLSILTLSLIAYYDYWFFIFLLSGELIIAANGVRRFSYFKHFNVSQTGRLKTVFLFLTISTALLTPLVNYLHVVLRFLFAITLVLQSFSLKGYLFTTK